MLGRLGAIRFLRESPNQRVSAFWLVNSMMMERSLPNLRIRLAFLPRATVLLAISVVTVVVSFAAKPGFSLLSYSDISRFLLRLLATGFGRHGAPQENPSSKENCYCPKSAYSTEKRSRRTWKVAVFLWVCYVFAQGSCLLSGQETGRVLVLYEQGLGTPAVSLADREIRDVLEKQSSHHIDFYTEYMETNLFSDSASQQSFREWYIQKYQTYRPNVIIAYGPTPIQFMIEVHDKYFHDVPVVIAGSFQQPPNNLRRDSQFTGTWLLPDPAKTLDVALQLQPEVKRVIVVNGASPFDRQVENIVHKSLHRFEDRIQFTYLDNFTITSLLAQLRELPNQTIILFGSVSEDATGHHFFEATQSLPIVLGAANAPVFTMADVLVGQGSVGGYVIGYAAQGRIAADIAMRILRGEKPRDIPFVAGTGMYLFDWRALRRWGLKGAALPAGSVVLNRQPTLWEAYGRYIWGGIFLLLAEGLLILELLRQRERESAAERHLRESEDKLRLILESTAEAIFGIDLEGRCTFCNPACFRALGYEHVEEILGRDMHSLLRDHRGDAPLPPVEEWRFLQATRTGAGVHADDEVLWRANGTSFPAEYWCYPQRRGREIVGAVVAFVDITQRKMSEAALASVSGKLIEAQEQERSRIARELHDDVGQRLALLAIELAQLQKGPAYSSEFPGRIGQLQKRTTEIAADIQSLSHELHSPRLQFLGIAAAMSGFCKEFGAQQKVEIDFETHDLPIPLSPDISLCFFRVLQEALHNAAKHSGTGHFEVRLWGTPDEIHLTVRDSGAGFDIREAKTGRGIGLISMEERLKILRGTLSIESQLQHGTTIHASAAVR
jgi:PAS domain S-box-containing protein